MKRSLSFLSVIVMLIPAPMQGDEITLTPTVIEVGKWPEGLSLIGEKLWVAESGQQSLAQYGATSGKLIERIKVGRLPVHLSTTGDTFFATINTEGNIWLQNAGTPGKVIGSTAADLPEALAAYNRSVYVLLHLDGSSADAEVMSLNPASGSTTRSPSLGSNASDLIVAGGNLWVISNPMVDGLSDGIISRLHPETLELLEQIPVGGRLLRMAEADGLLFVGGGDGESGTLLSIDSENGEMYGFADYSGSMVAAIGVESDFVVSADSRGAIHVHHQTSLIPQRTIHLSVETFNPRDLIVTPTSIYLSAHRGDLGIVYRVDDWKPGQVLEETPAATILRTETIAGVPLGLSESELEVRLGEPAKRGDPIENEVEGGFSVEVTYPAKGLVIVLAGFEKGDTLTVKSIRVADDREFGTAGGIRVGATLEEVRRAYGGYEDKRFAPVPTPPGKQFTFLAGSHEGGLFFHFEEGIVASIYLGAPLQ